MFIFNVIIYYNIFMRKKLTDIDFNGSLSKAKKRELKNRPRMKIHGKSLVLNKKHAGKKISTF